MSKAHKRIRRKVNPWKQQALIPSTGLGFYYGNHEAGRGADTMEDDGVFYDPESKEGRAITSLMEAIHGPFEGRTLAVGASRNVRI